MKVCDYIAQRLEAEGVRHVFEVAGGTTTNLIDSMERLGRPSVVSVHHEQAAAFAAEAAGRLTGVPGVAMATSGPGATNLLTGVASCFFDSSPAIFITGQVNRAEQKGRRAIRQLGFQETDVVAMAAPVTKGAFRVESAEQVPALFDEALRLALSGRPGPVLLDIPMDVQRAELNAVVRSWARPAAAGPSPAALDEIAAALRGASRPLILAGGGVRAAGAGAALRRLAEACQIPVVNSLMAVDALPAAHPLRIGLIGTYGNRWANLAVGRSDLLLVLGSRLDIRQTGADTSAFKKGRKIFHVDCEPGEVNNRVTGCVAVEAELKAFIEALAAKTLKPLALEAWRTELTALAAAWPDTAELAGVEGLNPNALMRALSLRAGAAAGYVVDVGQHQMWAAQSLQLAEGQYFMTSGGLGAMGFALPAAIGAAFSRPESAHVIVAGDGGFQLNIQELQTVARGALPLKIVVLNNRCHGMVRQFQESYFERRSPSLRLATPDFAAVAKAYGLGAAKVDRQEDLAAGLDALWLKPRQPFLLEVAIATQANAYPKIAFGRPMTEMEPLSKPLPMQDA